VGEVDDSRLKTHNLGAVLKLRPGDLLIAHDFPVSRGIHMRRVIVGERGDVEYGEYIIPPRQPQQFLHRHFQSTRRELGALRRELAALCTAGKAIDFGEEDTDQYEEPIRRLLRCWCHDEDVSFVSPADECYTDGGIRSDLRDRYGSSFEASWQVASGLIEQGRVAAKAAR